jgi:hypothetical protein
MTAAKSSPSSTVSSRSQGSLDSEAKRLQGRVVGLELAVKKTVRKPSGQFAEGTAPGSGRPKGCRNKFSGDLKEHILEALANGLNEDDAVDYLAARLERRRFPCCRPALALAQKARPLGAKFLGIKPSDIVPTTKLWRSLPQKPTGPRSQSR